MDQIVDRDRLKIAEEIDSSVGQGARAELGRAAGLDPDEADRPVPTGKAFSPSRGRIRASKVQEQPR